jgi:hypothetical protein
MSSRHAALTVLVAFGALLGGCASGPSYPLLTPVEIARSFGYSDIRLPDGRYEVSYVAPAMQGYGYRYDQSPTERQGKALAYDMAVWRAAQIALSQNYLGFTVGDTKSNADVQQIGGYYDDPWGPGWGPGWGGPPYWGWRRPPYGWGSYYYNPPETSVQIQVKLAVSLTNALKPGDYNAEEAIAQLRRTYPGAEGVVVGPAPAPGGGTVTPVPGPTPSDTSPPATPSSAPAPAASLPWQQPPAAAPQS